MGRLDFPILNILKFIKFFPFCCLSCCRLRVHRLEMFDFLTTCQSLPSFSLSAWIVQFSFYWYRVYDGLELLDFLISCQNLPVFPFLMLDFLISCQNVPRFLVSDALIVVNTAFLDIVRDFTELHNCPFSFVHFIVNIIVFRHGRLWIFFNMFLKLNIIPRFRWLSCRHPCSRIKDVPFS